MFRNLILSGSLLALAACGDPLKDFDRIGDVELAEDAAAQALPTDAEVAREGFFGTDAAMGEDEQVAPRAAPAAPSGGGFLSGLFGGGGSAAAGSGTSDDVAFGTVLPFGQVGRVCDAKGKDMGALVEKAQARGYALYDSRPGSAAARSYYVTGFGDGCPRQFTAANALFGAPSMYEQLHYGPGGDALPVTSTDQAYEKVKASFCRSGKGKPCGRRMGALEKTTVFISAYEHFEENARWADMLIHDGVVVAASVKSN